MTRKAIEKELMQNFPVRDKGKGIILKEELQAFTNGLETIQRIIKEQPDLKANFTAIKNALIDDFKLGIKGEGKGLTEDNRIIKVRDSFWGDLANRELILNQIDFRIIAPGGWLPGADTIKKFIPEIIKELSKGDVRRKFRLVNSKAKFLPWKIFVEQAQLCERIIKNKIEAGDILEEMIEYGRKRGQGREIISVSKEALKKLRK